MRVMGSKAVMPAAHDFQWQSDDEPVLLRQVGFGKQDHEALPRMSMSLQASRDAP